MSILQFILIVGSVIMLIFALDAYERKKLNFLHFLVFFGGGFVIAIFTYNSVLLDAFGAFFGIARGADLIVYLTIIFLGIMYFNILNMLVKDKYEYTKLNRAISINSRKGDLLDDVDNHTVFVIPAYNEGEDAIKVIGEILDKGYCVVFVDDGSKNNLSDKLLDKFSKKFDGRFVLIRHFVNMGQGGALQTGFDYIRLYGKSIRYVVTFDSDGQHRLEDLPNFENAFKKNKNIDIVLGSRFLGEAKNIPNIKRIVLKLGIIFTWIISGIRLTDTHNGYRMIRKSALEDIIITMNGMEHASEIIDIIKRKRLRYVEVPIVILYTEYSIRKGQKISNALNIAKRLIYKKFFFK